MEDLRLPLSPLQQEKPLRQFEAKTLGCPAPQPETPTGRYPCPGPFLPPRASLPETTLSLDGTRESLLPSEPNSYFSLIPQSHQGPRKLPTRQGQTSQLFAGPRSASRFPHAKLIKIGFLQSPSAHSKPHAPPHHSPHSKGGEVRVRVGGTEGQTDQPQQPEPESRSEGRRERQRKGPSGQLRGGKPAGGGDGRGRAGPRHPAALTSALSDGLSTAIFCHGSASCASGIFPPGPP